MVPWTVACQAALSKGFPSQEYWSGLPFRPPVGLPDPGIKPMSPASPALAGRFFNAEPPGKPMGMFIAPQNFLGTLIKAVLRVLGEISLLL